MAKQSQIEKAIAQLDSEVQVLLLAIAKLKAQQQTKTVKARPRAVPAKESVDNRKIGA